jgi:hypothetical protein
MNDACLARLGCLCRVMEIIDPRSTHRLHGNAFRDQVKYPSAGSATITEVPTSPPWSYTL